MNAIRDPEAIMAAWLDDGPAQLPTDTRQAIAVGIRTVTRRRPGIGLRLLGRPDLSRFAVALGSAAAVVVVAALALSFYAKQPSVGGLDTASPSPVPSATPSPPPTRAGTSSGAALLPEGSHMLWDREFLGRQIIVAIPAPDWYGEPGGGVLEKHDNSGAPDGAGLVVFAGPSRLFPHYFFVYGDPCHWSTTTPASPVTTVDEVVTALASQASRDASVPVDVTVSGYAGKAITLHVPDDAVFSDCDQGEFRTLVSAWNGSGDFIEDPGQPPSPDNYKLWEDESRTGTLRAQDAGQIDTLWIFHVEEVGLVMIDAAYYDGTPQSVVDELIAIVESARVSGPPD